MTTRHEWCVDTSVDRILVIDLYAELDCEKQEKAVNDRLEHLWDEWGSEAHDMSVGHIAVTRVGDYITLFVTVRIIKEYREPWPDRPASFVPELV